MAHCSFVDTYGSLEAPERSFAMSVMRRVLPVGALLLLALVALSVDIHEVRAAPTGAPPAPAAVKPVAEPDPHAKVFAESRYPSAAVCATCHPQQYDEWRYSAHAYASISPMFHKFEQRISELAQGTVGYFCMRCHASVSTSLKETREEPLWQRSRVSREGVTCVTCHRVNENFAKVN